MRIAIASQNFRTITGHGGKTRRWLIYETSEDSQPTEVERLDLPREMAFHDFHGDGPHPIDGVDILMVASAGDGFVRRLEARGITVVLTGETDPVQAVADYLRGEVKTPQRHEHHH